MPKNKLTPEQREKIVELAGQGMAPKEIGKQLSIDPLRVAGSISYAVRQGQLPGSAEGTRRAPKPPPAGPALFPSRPVSQPEVSMNPSSAPMPAPAPVTSAPDDQGWRTAGQGSGYGFTHPTQALEFKLERIEPRDGVLEVSQSEPEDDEIGKRFGSGTYRLWRREGTKLPVFRDIVISLAYGESRYPNRRPAEPQRPLSRFLSGRSEQSQDDDDRMPPRPFYRPQMDVRSYQPDNRQMADVARTGLTAQESIAVTAVNKLAEINEKQMDRMEKERDREREPQSIVTDFLKEQQAAAERRAAEEARRREEERKIDRSEWERREQEREAQHRRDMERIKAENDARIAQEREARQTMLDLEKQKMEILREENRAREAALKAELERIRVEAKEERTTLLAQITKIEEKAEEQADEVQDTIKEELEKGRTSLSREFDLKEKHLENEQKLKEDMLKLREELVKGQQNEDISKVLTKLVEGIERTVKEVVDLKKIEAVSAEERLAKVGQGGAPAPGQPGAPANVTQAPGALVQKTPEQPVAMQGQKTGNGHAPQQQTVLGPDGQEQTPEMMIRQLAREPVFINMISKWAKQLQAGNDAGVFSNMFMELMRDDGTVEALKIRKACSYFVDEMSTKSWVEMYEFLKPAIPQNLHATFETSHAEVFYNQFKMMVVESVRDYWKMYFAQKQAEVEAQRQATQPAAGPALEPDAEPSAESAPAPEIERQESQQPQSGPAIPSAPAMQAEAPAEEPKPEVTVHAA